MKNVFYMHKISSIGGVESFLYYLSKIYNDFVVYYKEADPVQIKRLAQNVEVHKYTQPIKCDRFFCNYGFDIEVEAKEYYHIVHYDPLNVGFTPMTSPGFKYIGVSKVACYGFEKKTGNKCELIYNVLPIEKPKVEKKPGLNLISATRLTSEKGGDRINKLALMLDRAGIEYHWVIYTNKHRVFKSPNIEVRPQKLDLTKEVAESSYLVQLSDCESFGLSVCESLILGTPVIITPLEAFKEIGCIHGVNAVVCDFNMEKVDLSMIKENNLKFDYKPPKSTWDKYLSNKGTYNPNEKIKVRTTKRIYDIELDRHYIRNQEVELTRARVAELEAKGLVK